MSFCTTSLYLHSIFKMKVRVTLLCGDQKTAFIPVPQELTRFPSSCFFSKFSMQSILSIEMLKRPYSKSLLL